jgi:putative ABC transport system permease protein
VFFLRYLRSELVRRRARTVLTVSGLALGVALVVTISGLSRGLDRAQKTALDPLSGIGTDLTVTRGVQTDNAGFGGGPPGGGGSSFRDLVQSNESVLTDLSKLGKPGDHFVHDFFLPGAQLTFPTTQGESVKSLAGVAAVAQGLLLIAEHQEGVVPKIVAKLKTGGQTFRIRRQIQPLTAAEQQQMQACLAKNGVTFGAPPQQQPQGGGGFDQGSNGAGQRRFDRGAFQKCLPARLRRFIGTFTTPQQTLRQVLDPPQTNIRTTPYTIGGVDQTQPDIGLVTRKQVVGGRYLARAGGPEALVSRTYARAHSLKLGSKLDLNGRSFAVVGLVAPPLGGQTADVYLPLKQLQSLAGQAGKANVILVRADKGSSVGAVQKQIEQKLGGAQVATAKDVADRVSGSLVDASNLAHNLGVVLEIVVAAAAFLMAALLTLSSVGKRVRELGTLKAIGWTQRLVVRQVVGESVVQGALGGVVGILLGVAAALVIGAAGPTLTASSSTGSVNGLLGAAAVRTAHETLSLDAPLNAAVVVGGLLLALLGGLIAGAAGGLRAARLRPAEALRRVD